jgi:hypothetical protein
VPVTAGPRPAVRRRRRAFGATVAVAATAFLLGAAPVAHASLVGSANDPVGDATDPSPGRDLIGAGLAYDKRRGALVGAVGLRQDPTRETGGLLTLFAGTRTTTGCDGYPAIGFATSTSAFDARWTVLTAPGAAGPSDGARKRGGQTTLQRFEVVDARLKGRTPDCAVATLTAPGDASVVWDTTGPIALVPQPALAGRLTGVPKELRAGRTQRVRVTLTNDGDAPTRAGRLTFAGARGLKTTPRSAKVPAIPAGGRRTTTFRVSLTRRARPTTTLRVTATAGEQRVRAEGRVRLRRPARSGGGGGGSLPDLPRTCTRYSPDLFGDTGGSLVLVPC